MVANRNELAVVVFVFLRAEVALSVRSLAASRRSFCGTLKFVYAPIAGPPADTRRTILASDRRIGARDDMQRLVNVSNKVQKKL
jgi:hypothetical protein